MQLIIPMTGQGSRFVKAGFERLKPFIPVHGKPLIEWVLKMFPGILPEKIIFILQRHHYESMPYIQSILQEIAPLAKISLLDKYDTRGPVPNILHSSHLINDHEPVFISYCDFYMRWDFIQFNTFLHNENLDGAIPCYTDFHPHLISSPNFYACCKSDAKNNLIEVREKFSFTENKTQSMHSPGVYYFKNGALLKKYFQTAMDLNLSTNGEFYCSLPFNLMVNDQLRVLVTKNVEYFCQWGTPEDLSQYLSWFEHLVGGKKTNGFHGVGRNTQASELHGFNKLTMQYWREFMTLEGIIK